MRPSPAAPAGRVRPSSNYPPKKAPRSSSATCGASRARPGTDSDPLKPGLAACSPWRPTRRDRPALVRLLLALLRSLTCPEGADPQWLQVDLGATHSVTEVKLAWEAAYGKSYTIQTSDDGKAWTTIYTTTTGNGGSDDLTGLAGSGRYVRMNGTARGTSYGYSLYELQVYGS